MNRLSVAIEKGHSTVVDDHFLEWLVDGIPLRVRICEAEADARASTMTTSINDGFRAQVALERLRRMMGRAPGDFPVKRVALLVCEECGDLGCGAFSARVQTDDEAVRWTLIGYQNDYEPFAPKDATTLVFEFDRQAYEETLDRLVEVLAARVAADPDANVDILSLSAA